MTRDKISLSGKLYVVSTPIGNPDDITPRAINVLKHADYIAAEDTRRAGKLLKLHKIKGRLISCHEHNEKERSRDLTKKLLSGHSIALVSDAGSPVISDPGSYLIKKTIESGISVVPIPGASAAILALTASGLPADSFVFAGFCPRKKSKRQKRLEALSGYPETLIFYESPRRILSLMEEMIAIMGDRDAALSREMTKRHEEFIRGKLSAVSENLKQRSAIKGECALVVAGSPKKKTVSMETVREKLRDAMWKSDASLSDIARDVAKRLGVPKKKAYAEALKIKRSLPEKQGNSGLV